MPSDVHVIVRAANEIIRRRRKPTYEELEKALRDALSRIEAVEEYARRQMILAAEVVNPWKN